MGYIECTGCGGFSEFDDGSSEGAVDGMGSDGGILLSRSFVEGGVQGGSEEVMQVCD